MHKRGHRRARGEHSHNIPMPHMPLAGKLVPFTEEVCWHIKQEPSKYTHGPETPWLTYQQTLESSEFTQYTVILK